MRGFQLKVVHLCNAPVSAYPASMEAELEAAERWEAEVRSALRLVHGPPRTATPLQRLLPAKATTISSKTSSIQLASRIIRRERSQVFGAGVVDFPSPIKQPVLLVFLNTIQILERLASSLLFALLFLVTELQMALFQCHSMKRARRQIQRWVIGRVRAGSAQLGVSRRGRLFVVCAFGRWAASAPGFRSGFCAGSRLLVVRLVGPSVRVGHNTRARLCGGGGGGDGTWRAALCLSRASGSLLARAPFGSFLIFFAVGANPGRPGGRSGWSSSRWVGILCRNRAFL